jgi:prevent-host-death family protein
MICGRLRRGGAGRQERTGRSSSPVEPVTVAMKTLTAKDAKYRFGCLIDLAPAEPVVIAKHGRPVIVVLAVKEFEQLLSLLHTLPVFPAHPNT